jgi:hypothetical protein
MADYLIVLRVRITRFFRVKKYLSTYDFVKEYFAMVDGFVTEYSNDVWKIYFGISFSAHAHAHMFTK